MDEPSPPPLPENLPPPVDDGAAAHLWGKRIPNLILPSTHGADADLGELSQGALVLYVFPKLGRPDEPDVSGWNETPGARGCTQQSCSFRDRHHRFRELGYSVAGLSAQSPGDQAEAAQRLQLAFPLLADPDRELGEALELPIFAIAGMAFYKRLTLVVRAGRIDKVFYPVFPPDANAEEVLEWIQSEPAAR
jgi:peroxiredoxin